MKKLIIIFCAAIVTTPCVFSATPTFVQSIAAPAAGAFAFSKDTMTLPNPSGSGNLLMLVAQTGASGNAFTFNDDKANYWNKTVQVNDTPNGQSLAVAFSTNVAANTQRLWVDVGNNSYSEVFALEFFNVGIGSVTEGEAAVATSGTQLSAGNINTTTDGDLLITVVSLDNWPAQKAPMQWTAMGGCTLAAISGTGFMAVQYCIQAVHGTTNPFITSSINATGAMVKTFALKSAALGSDLASGIRVRRINTESAENGTTYITFANGGTAPSFQMPTSGNLLAFGYTGRPTNIFTTVTSVPSLSWASCPGAALSAGSGNTAWWWYAPNATVGVTSITVSGFTSTPGFIFNFFDISGADTAPFDVCSSTNDINNTVNSGAVGTVNGSTITPTTANGLVLHLTQEDRHTVTATSPGYFVAPDVAAYAGSNLETDQGLSLFYNPTATLIKFILTYSGYEGGGPGPGALCSQAIAFKAAPPPPPPPPPLPTQPTIIRAGIIRRGIIR